MICTCTHHVAAHDGYRPGRSGADGCLASGCGCKNYVSGKRNSVSISSSGRAMTEVERQVWRDSCRTVKKFEQTFGVRYSRD